MPKSIKQKQNEYKDKYGDIPLNLKDRLEYMYDKYNIDEVTARKIINERYRRMNNLYYTKIEIILYQEPQGAKRPRYRFINRNITIFTYRCVCVSYVLLIFCFTNINICTYISRCINFNHANSSNFCFIIAISPCNERIVFLSFWFSSVRESIR